ncbi:hypothetical protein LOK46_01140 [Methylobacterium sp. NMS14P]|uniref:hypothetical protein n=1 Tax=Methylobacterium sp. NMS14P TaxID=2894310 RepID=UPI00235987EF|nr:hypothetical protein [Methylobacterium sp. NMS14P]WCS25476.1 hypothetical protein LOK46_01140 [Methylobacterium sp. NMS14P]
MIEQAPRIAREFHVGVGGDRWALTRDVQTGQPYVSHRPGDDAPEVQLDLGSFLVLFTGEEREKLLDLIASLLPDAEALGDAGARPGAARPLPFVSRWLPSRQPRAPD